MDALEEMMQKKAKVLEAALKKETKDMKVRGYPLTVESGEGPTIFIKMEGASGDITALKKLKKIIVPVGETLTAGMGDDASVKITAANKGEDMTVSVEIQFP